MSSGEERYFKWESGQTLAKVLFGRQEICISFVIGVGDRVREHMNH